MSIIVPITTFTENGEFETIGRIIVPVVELTEEECDEQIG